MKLYFNYSLDCETPPNTEYTGPERRPFFHGPRTWEFAEESVRGFVEQMDELGVREGSTLFVYPDVARHQKKMYRELADSGVEIGLHLNGLRYSKLRGADAKWMGEMNRAEQKRALAWGKQEIEDVTGKPCNGYRACYGSSNDDTFPILEELGFTWSSNSSQRYRPEFFSCWAGNWPFGHHASRVSKLICGDLKLYEIPVTVGFGVYYDEKLKQPLDLRVETPPDKLGGESRPKLRDIIRENVIEMEHRNAPIRAIIGGSHNTNPFRDRASHQAKNLDACVRYTREVAAEQGMEFVAAPFETMLADALAINAY